MQQPGQLLQPDSQKEQQSRVWIAIVLCLVVLWGYQFFLAPKPQPQPQQPPTPPGPEVAEPGATDDGATPTPDDGEAVDGQPEAGPGPAPRDREEEPFRRMTRENDVMRLVFSSEDAGLESLVLLDYFETTAHEKPVELLRVFQEGERSLVLRGVEGLGVWPWKVIEETEDRIVFETVADTDLVLRRTFHLPRGEDRHLIIEQTLENPTDAPISLAYALRGAHGIFKEDVGYGSEPEGIIAKTDKGDPRTVAPKKVSDKAIEDASPLDFVGVQAKYFVALLYPLEPRAKGLLARVESVLDERAVAEAIASLEEQGRTATVSERAKIEKAARQNVSVSLVTKKFALEPGEAVTHTYLFIAGPKLEDLMLSYAEAPEGLDAETWTDPDFGRLLFTGLTGGISRFFVAVLEVFVGVIQNWGFAIIMLTLLVRAALHPLNRKAQKSMHAMSKLKPQMEAIKEKYKGRKSKESAQKMQRETLDLYRQHGVNPAGGCLPMFFQFPIFIGLYWGINQAVDLRQAPFLLWIDDLSKQDCLAHLPFQIPFLGTSCFNLLPILVIVSWILQQQMQPKPADPQMAQQQKVMKYMLVFMGFLFYTVPSGLNLYFLTSATLGMVENKWIKNQLAAEPETPPPPPPSAKPKPAPKVGARPKSKGKSKGKKSR